MPWQIKFSLPFVWFKQHSTSFDSSHKKHMHLLDSVLYP